MLSENEEGGLELLAHRKSEVRCLDCGSHDFDVIPKASPHNEINCSGTHWQSDLIYNNYSGEIHVIYSSINFNMRYVLRIETSGALCISSSIRVAIPTNTETFINIL